MVGAIVLGGVLAALLGFFKGWYESERDKKPPPSTKTPPSKPSDDQDDKCAALKDAVDNANSAISAANDTLEAAERASNWQLGLAIVATAAAALAATAAFFLGWTPAGAAAIAAAVLAAEMAAEAWTKYAYTKTRVDQAKTNVANKIRERDAAQKKFTDAGCDKKTKEKPKTDRKQPGGDSDKKPGEQGRP